MCAGEVLGVTGEMRKKVNFGAFFFMNK